MIWKKRGLIFAPARQREWLVTHAQAPLAHACEDAIRIFFSTRDGNNRTVAARLDVEPDDPGSVRSLCGEPVLGLGGLGSFDECGAMPSSVVCRGSELWLYYTGWNVGQTVPYRNSIGLALSSDQGMTFTRAFNGPIMDRSRFDPYFVTMPFVMADQGIWRMWYSSCVKWEIIDGRVEPFYNIRHAESSDGIAWKTDGPACIDFQSPGEAGLVRPFVIKERGEYRMWYCRRGFKGYRTDNSTSYRIGYAESADGLSWRRMDHEAGIDVSEDGWDSEMVAYPWIVDAPGRRYLLYNGNGFGKTGFGYAVAADDEKAGVR